MISTDVKIQLDLAALDTQFVPDVMIGLDDHCYCSGPVTAYHSPVVIHRALTPGIHRVWIQHQDHRSIMQTPHAAVLINAVRFQHGIDHDFRHHSKYRPDYPEHWIEQNRAQGRTLEPVILSNHLGWPGIWWIDFKVPIYNWIHKQLNLGWLLT